MDFGSVFEITAWDFVLLALLAVFVYRWWRRPADIDIPRPKPVDPLPMQDMTLEQLRKYNGVDNDHVLFALFGTIYDVTRSKQFYGPGGPYEAMAGRDATRSLATMDVKAIKDDWDSHDDLTPDQKETAVEWQESFKYKYPTVGKLIKDESEREEYGGKLSTIHS